MSGGHRWAGWLTSLRLPLAVIVVALLLGHAFSPTVVHIDAPVISLALIAAMIVLAPLLTSAKLPGGAEFNFREKFQEAEAQEEEVEARIRQELPPLDAENDLSLKQRQPGLIEIDDELRRLAREQPLAALGALRVEIAQSLRRSARAAGFWAADDQDVARLIRYLAEHGLLWPEQQALLKTLLELTNALLLSGRAIPGDVDRVLALLDTLNMSFGIGYSPNFEANPDWHEQGLICQYEHCIEHMPLPQVPRSEQIKWRDHIGAALRGGRYDEVPERKRWFEKILAEPIPDDAPEKVDRVGACPIFGHYCPGGPGTVDGCVAAQDWLSEQG